MRISSNSARRAVQGLGERGKTTRIPDEVRAAVLDYADKARSAGRTWSDIGEAVGLSATVVQRWSRGSQAAIGRTSERKSRFTPVLITQAPATAATSPMILTTASGERLEGLGVEDAIQLLRGLR